MDGQYTIPDLAERLPLSRRQIDRLLSGCPHTEQKTRGGTCKEYRIEDLPAEWQQTIISQEYNIDKDFVPKSGATEEQVKELLTAWDAAPQWNKDIASMRRSKLDEVTVYAASENIPITTAQTLFAELYNKRSVPGVDKEYYHRIKKLSGPNLDLWRRKFLKFGLAGLLTERDFKRGMYTALAPEMKVFLSAQLALNPDIRVQRLWEMLPVAFPDAKKIPCRKSVENWVKKQWRGKGAVNEELHTRRTNPQKWRNKFMPAFGNRTAGARYFCDKWEIDSTINDVILEGVRYAVIVCIDEYSRRIKIVRQPTSTSIGVAACIRACSIDWGVPDTILTDNGKDYVSAQITAATTALGINTPPLLPFSPHLKGCVERVIGTFNRYVAEILPGFCGHNVADRQALRERGRWLKRLQMPGEPVRLDINCKQFDEIVEAFIKKYERTPHRGLRGKTPLQVSLESKRQPQKITDERVLDLLLAPVASRTVQKRGIELDGGFYTSAELADYVTKRVHIRRDLADAGQIFVFEALDGDQNRGRFLCKAYDAGLSGEKLTEYMARCRHNEKAGREHDRAMNTLSRTTVEPYVLLLDQGEIVEEPSKIVPFKPEADSPAIREARRAVDNQTDQSVVPLPTGCTVIESATRFERPDEKSKWDHHPKELEDNPIMLLDWYEDKRKAVGLTDNNLDYIRYLKRQFPLHYDEWEDMEKEKAALGVPPSQIP